MKESEDESLDYNEDYSSDETSESDEDAKPTIEITPEMEDASVDDAVMEKETKKKLLELEEEEKNMWREWDEEYKKELDKIREEEKRKQEELDKKVDSAVISKEEKEDAKKGSDEIEIYSVLGKWLSCFNKKSFKNEFAGKLLLHVLLGQALNKMVIKCNNHPKLDGRQHLLWLQDTSSGKGEALKFFDVILKHPEFKKYDPEQIDPILPYKVYKANRFSAAAFLNTLKPDKINKNSYSDEMAKGILETYDFIIANEARQFLETNPNSSEIQDILMEHSSVAGHNVCSKQLMGYEKSADTKGEATFILTSRHIGQLLKTTLCDSGFFNRFLFLPINIDSTRRREMNYRNNRSYMYCTTEIANTQNESITDIQPINELVKELNKVIGFGIANINNMAWDKEQEEQINNILDQKSDYYADDIENNVTSETNRNTLQGFTGRYADRATGLAFQAAIMRFKNRVQLQDLDYAYKIIDHLYRLQKEWLEENIQDDKEKKWEKQQIRNYIQSTISCLIHEKKEALMAEVADKAKKKFNKSKDWAYKRITEMSIGNSAIIKIKGKEGSKYNIKCLELNLD